MDMTNKMKKSFLWLLAGFVSFVMIGCGGSSSSSDSNVAPPSKLITISDQNADAVLVASVQSVPGTMVFQEIFAGSSSSTVTKSTSALKMAAKITSTDLSSIVIAESGTETCSGGGSLSYDGNEETGGTVIYNECVEYGMTIDGKVILTIDGFNLTAELIGTKIQMDDIVVFCENAIIRLNEQTNDFSETMTGYAIQGGHKFEFEDYSVAKTGNNYTFSGLVKTDCMGGWIEIKTIQALELPNDGCPTAGEIVAIGNNSELKTVFNADQSVDVFVNGQSYASYGSCDELPLPDEVCQ